MINYKQIFARQFKRLPTEGELGALMWQVVRKEKGSVENVKVSPLQRMIEGQKTGYTGGRSRTPRRLPETANKINTLINSGVKIKDICFIMNMDERSIELQIHRYALPRSADMVLS